jgi:phytoene desaturase
VADVAVIGAGVGGLAAAIRLRCGGHRVTVFERNDHLGGKLATHRRDGFSFDAGPTLLTLPAVFDDLFRVAGTTLASELNLVRLDHQFRYRWPDGSVLDVVDDVRTTAQHFERFHPGGGAGWLAFTGRGRKVWDVAQRTFLSGPLEGPWSLLTGMRSPRDLVAIDGARTLHRAARAAFRDPRLQQWAGRYATYSGSSPYGAAATFACIAYLESHHGCWYVTGGLGALRDALVRVAARRGVVLATGADVTSIEHRGGRVTGLVLSSGARPRADVVVANADAEQVMGSLLHDAPAAARIGARGRSMSAFVIMAGVRGQTAGIAHHNVWFSGDERAEFAQIAAGAMPADPTVYVCVSAVSDTTQAPAGDENWFVLVNAPARAGVVDARYVDVVWAALRRRGVDLRGRVLFTDVISPDDVERRDRSVGGAIYGMSSNGRRAAFRRPRNRGPLDGLYLVGGSTHPGGGLPLVALSGRIVSDMVRNDGW